MTQIGQIAPITDRRRDPQTYRIIGAAMDVHGALGPWFLERVYREALTIELAARQISFRRESECVVRYKDEVLPVSFRVDFVCFGSVLVELKAVKEITSAEHAQVFNYLKASGLERALLLNFGARRLEFHRLILSTSPRAPSIPSA